MIELFVAYGNKMMSKKNHHTLGYQSHQTLKEKKRIVQFETGNWKIIIRPYKEPVLNKATYVCSAIYGYSDRFNVG